MKRTYIGVKSGIMWTFTESLADLDFADDISLLAHSHRDIKERRSVEREMKAIGWSWGQVANLAADRPRRRSSVSALCASMHEED